MPPRTPRTFSILAMKRIRKSVNRRKLSEASSLGMSVQTSKPEGGQGVIQCALSVFCHFSGFVVASLYITSHVNSLLHFHLLFIDYSKISYLIMIIYIPFKSDDKYFSNRKYGLSITLILQKSCVLVYSFTQFFSDSLYLTKKRGLYH